MSSVTKRVSEVKQPRGGYIKPSQFELRQLDDGKLLFENENIHVSIVGMAVDYLTRLSMGTSVEEAFFISFEGAKWASLSGITNAIASAHDLAAGIKGLDAQSIVNACKLTTFDVWRRDVAVAPLVKSAEEILPDNYTIHNIQTMVTRSIDFWQEYGPITKDGFTFEYEGYTSTVNGGDGDFLTSDTMWDFKVSKAKPTNKHTLQLLMYWIMGQHSGKAEFKNITKLGIFNPRLNSIYTLDVSKIEANIIRSVESDVICY